MDDLIKLLAEKGTIELLLAISIVGNVVQYRQYTNVQNLRVKETNDQVERVVIPLRDLRAVLDRIVAALTSVRNKDNA